MNSGTYSPSEKVLVLGGGQLGRMLAEAATPLGVSVTVLDPDESPPAASIAEHIRGDFSDRDTILAASKGFDLVTIEIEHVNTEALYALEHVGVSVFPQARIIEMVQDKLLQKRFLSAAGFPVVPVLEKPDPQRGAIRKSRFGGYDGNGVVFLKPGQAVFETDSPPAQDLWFLEERVNVNAELSVLVARDHAGNLAVYEPLQMMADQTRNLLTQVLWPADIGREIQNEALKIAGAVVDHLSGVGIFAIEFFVGDDGSVTINEIAPRPHNSGHLTIEAAVTGQFEQHIRAICGLPLGSPNRLRHAAMVNLIGEGSVGPPALSGISRALSIPEVHFHWYGKRASRPGRKMGHLTICGQTAAELRDRVIAAGDVIVQGETNDKHHNGQ